MLSDRMFFPLFILVILAIIVAAFVYGPQADNANHPFAGDPLQGFLIEGDDLNLIDGGPWVSRKFIDDPIEGKFVRTSSGQPDADKVPHAGATVAFLPDMGQAWQGHTLYFSVIMRKSKRNGSDKVLLRFYAMAQGGGKKTICEVSEQWQPCYTKYIARVSDKPPNTSYIGIWPDIKGIGRSIDIQRIELQVDKPFDNNTLND